MNERKKIRAEEKDRQSERTGGRTDGWTRGWTDARRVAGEGLTRGLLVCEIQLARRAERQRKVPREQDRPLALDLRGKPDRLER